MQIIDLIKKYRFELANLMIGMSVLTFELTASRIVAPYIGATIQVWTSIIGVILASLALGYWIGGYVADKRHKQEDVIWLILSAAILITAVNIFKDPMLSAVTASSLNLPLEAFLVSLLLFAPPTIVLGAASPYILRLSITSVATSGRHIGRIDAAGTLGSLIGTFATGYFLFGLVGTRHLLSLLAVLLILATLLISIRVMLWQRLIILLLAAAALPLASSLQVSGLQKEIDTSYSRVFVRDTFINGRPGRVMQFDSLGWQSGYYKDAPAELAFGYVRGFAAAAQASDPGNILVIGGGAFTLPVFLAGNYPHAQVDVVEIDGRLADISEKYFNFKPLANLHVFNADGREFINNNSRKYDLIFVDAFTSITPPFQLFTLETVNHLKQSLNKQGKVAVNVIAAPSGPAAALPKIIDNTYTRGGFSRTAYYRLNNSALAADLQNLLLVAGSDSLPDKLSYQSSYPGGTSQVFDRTRIDSSASLVLTDDYAPVEWLSNFR